MSRKHPALSKRRPTSSYLLGLVCGALLWALPARAEIHEWQAWAMEQSGRVGPEVATELVSRHMVRVLVTYDVIDPATERVYQTFHGGTARRLLHRHAEQVLERLSGTQFVVRRRFQSINAMALEVDAEAVLSLLDDPLVTAIDLDVGGSAALREAIPAAAVDQVQLAGYRGAGVTIAVIDSGIDRKHKSLKKAVRAEACFCATGGGCCPNGSDRQRGRKSAGDAAGHGTHVAGILASRGRKAPKGVAPKADLVVAKVLDANNVFCCYSDVLAALDWIVSERPEVDVINMSLGTSALFKGKCDGKLGALSRSTATAVRALQQRGTMVFASAGNEAERKKMSLPACVKSAVAVGAVYDADIAGTIRWSACTDVDPRAGEVTCFSNLSKQTDLVAPGALISSTRLGGGEVIFGGTSMASPMAAGCAALLREAYPQATAKEIERALKSSANKVKVMARRYPTLDCEQALLFLGG